MRWPVAGSLAVTLISAVTLIDCAHQPGKSVTETPRPQAHSGPLLSRTDAQERAKQISDISYQLHFDLTDSGPRYHGSSLIRFNVLMANRDLRVDFEEGEVLRLELDGQPVEPSYNAKYIVIPGPRLSKGAHQLTIEFSHEYSRQGRGLSRFIDPIDKLTYVTTQFEPYDANFAFPCFDQPDLKATFATTVKAPKAWEVISAARESEVSADGANKLWTFPAGPRFSTYVFSLHAGPFAKWEDSKFRIPLRLFARKSMSRFVKSDEWFPITRHGMDFFESYFSTPYPFKKYDQIIVPEFNAGAMENVAAVTFNEAFIARGAKQRNQIRGLAITILHEMAHMWFGDLVTMKWWGDLWLNESFATYMSSVALAASPDYPEAWRMFFSGKSGAYYEDQLLTTHPVVAQVRDTQEAFVAFDSITYGKGASVLKQLHFTLGDEAFKLGLKIYFQRYAEKNSEYKDFMGAMAEASNQDLGAWQQTWFETAGLNSISAQYECRDNKISQFALLQNAVSGQTVLRPHSMELALLKRSGGKVTVSDVIKVKTTAATTYIPEAIGKACPHMVYPNHNDYGYIKVKLDDHTVNSLKYSVNEIDDPLLRQQLWAGLWDKVRDAELSFRAYADLVVPETLAREKDDLILRSLFYSIYGRPNASLLFYFNQGQGAKREDLADFTRELEKIVWQRLTGSKRGGDDQLVWYEAFAGSTTSQAGLSLVKRVLNGSQSIPGLALDQDRRWSLVHLLAVNNDSEALKYIEAEAHRDPSSKGVEAKIASLAARPDWAEKQKWLAEYKKEKSEYSLSQLRAAMYSLFPRNQNDLRDRYAPDFFTDMDWANANKNMIYSGMLTALSPWECTLNSKGMIGEYLERSKGLFPAVVKNLKITQQEGERCRKIIALGESGARFSIPTSH